MSNDTRTKIIDILDRIIRSERNAQIFEDERAPGIIKTKSLSEYADEIESVVLYPEKVREIYVDAVQELYEAGTKISDEPAVSLACGMAAGVLTRHMERLDE